VQGGQSCCFHQVAAALSFSCNSVRSAPSQARWGNSVLNAVLYPIRSAPGSITCHALGGCLCPHLHSQLLYLSHPLLGARLPTLGGLLVDLPILSVFVIHWEFGTESFAPYPSPIPQGRFSIPPSPLLSVLDYSLLFRLFSFVGWWFSLPRGCAELCSYDG
jgi:hypothetical protein